MKNLKVDGVFYDVNEVHESFSNEKKSKMFWFRQGIRAIDGTLTVVRTNARASLPVVALERVPCWAWWLVNIEADIIVIGD